MKKIIIEFRFRMMWRILQITEDRIIQAEIHLASAFTASVDNILAICIIILHVLLSLIH